MRALVEDRLREYIREGKHEKAATILREILIEWFTLKIQEKNKDYMYTDMINLISAAKIYLNDDIKHLPMYIDDFSDEPTDYIEDLDRMLDIYSRLKNS